MSDHMLGRGEVYRPLARNDVITQHNLDLSIRVSNLIAIIGSASGQPTIAALLQWLRHPDTATVIVGGCPVVETDTHYLRAHILIVNQHPMLFNASVAQNIPVRFVPGMIRQAEVNRYGALMGENATCIYGSHVYLIACTTLPPSSPPVIRLPGNHPHCHGTALGALLIAFHAAIPPHAHQPLHNDS